MIVRFPSAAADQGVEERTPVGVTISISSISSSITFAGRMHDKDSELLTMATGQCAEEHTELLRAVLSSGSSKALALQSVP
jgi:hypothetical protein